MLLIQIQLMKGNIYASGMRVKEHGPQRQGLPRQIPYQTALESQPCIPLTASAIFLKCNFSQVNPSIKAFGASTALCFTATCTPRIRSGAVSFTLLHTPSLKVSTVSLNLHDQVQLEPVHSVFSTFPYLNDFNSPSKSQFP